MAWQFSAGEVLTATNLNAVTIPWNARAQARRSSTQSIANATPTAIIWNATDIDPLDWHDAAGANTLFIPTIAGWYQLTLGVTMGTDTDYTALLFTVQKNAAGGAFTFVMAPIASSTPGVCFSTPLISLNGSTDSLRVLVQQNNTSAAANNVAAESTCLVELAYPT